MSGIESLVTQVNQGDAVSKSQLQQQQQHPQPQQQRQPVQPQPTDAQSASCWSRLFCCSRHHKQHSSENSPQQPNTQPQPNTQQNNPQQTQNNVNKVNKPPTADQNTTTSDEAADAFRLAQQSPRVGGGQQNGRFTFAPTTPAGPASAENGNARTQYNIPSGPNVDILPGSEHYDSSILNNGFYMSAAGQPYLLPPLRAPGPHKKTLVLDLDETLVHSSFKPVDDADFQITIELDGTYHQVYVRKRPYVDEFLRHIARDWEVVIFTASLAKYADPLLDILDQDHVITSRLFRESCVHHYHQYYVKDLTTLGRSLSDCTIIDNSPFSYMFQPEQGVPIISWYEDRSDTQLLALLPFLDMLAHCEDIGLTMRICASLFDSYGIRNTYTLPHSVPMIQVSQQYNPLSDEYNIVHRYPDLVTKEVLMRHEQQYGAQQQQAQQQQQDTMSEGGSSPGKPNLTIAIPQTPQGLKNSDSDLGDTDVTGTPQQGPTLYIPATPQNAAAHRSILNSPMAHRGSSVPTRP